MLNTKIDNDKNIGCKGINLVLKYVFKRDKFGFFISLFVSAVSTVCSISSYMVLSEMIDKFVTVYANKGKSADFNILYKYLGIMVVLFLISALSLWISKRIAMMIAERNLKNIRDDLFEHIQLMKIKDIESTSTGALMSLFTNDTEIIRFFILDALTTVFGSTFMLLAIVVAMFYYSYIFAFVTIFLIIIMLTIVVIISKISTKYFSNQQQTLADINSYSEEIILGQKIVKIFSHEEKVKTEFEEKNKNLLKNSTRATIMSNIPTPIVTSFGYINLIVIGMLGAIFMLSPDKKISSIITPGIFTSFIFLAKLIAQPVSAISQQIYVILYTSAGTNRVYSAFQTAIEHIELNKKNNTTSLIDGDIEFKNVCFSYDGNKKVLEDISFEVKKHSTIAFVGSTGAGKTTIISLINRFYDIDSGEILIDGKNIMKYNLKELRESFAYVLQDSYLFTGSVIENIRYGRLDATDQEVKQAAKMANAHDFIERLPNGYNTILKSNGSNLSQGQKQLITIARAIISKRNFLILDESTSSVDTRTESLIQESIKNLINNKTVFMIAHRLNTIKFADQIIVLEHGKIVEKGTHKDLINLRGRYYNLYKNLANGKIDEEE